MTCYGPEIGSYGQRPIYAFIIHEGIRLVYEGVVALDAEGRPIPATVQEGDYLLGGRLIYRRDDQADTEDAGHSD